ncbi:MAG: hypothetical protein GXO85_05450 [Chlorobi bacterium]|nr:hypothetical protein [Chlorobiota bacterium]
MKKIDEEKILKMYSGLLSDSEAEELKNSLDNSSDPENFTSRLEDELTDMKEIYQNYPEPNYFHNLSNTVISKVEESKTSMFQPSFAYALAIAIVVFVASQLMNFNTVDSNSEYAAMINASDLEEYISDQLLDMDEFAEVIISDSNELDYAEYLLSNTGPTEMFQASEENEILNLLDESVEEAIFNELVNKKIL